MRINVDMDSAELERLTAGLGQRQIAFAAVNAINETAKLIQRVQRERVDDLFELRKPRTSQFIQRQAAVIKPFANVKDARPFAEVAVGQAPRLLLAVYEKGGEKTPVKGRRFVAVPVTGGPARRTFASPVAETLYLRKLNIRARKTKAGAIQYKGRDRTFVLKRTDRNFYGGVYQRVGPEREDVRLVYSFKQKPRLRAMLGFQTTADRVAREWLDRNFREQFERELARAQRRAG